MRINYIAEVFSAVILLLLLIPKLKQFYSNIKVAKWLLIGNILGILCCAANIFRVMALESEKAAAGQAVYIASDLLYAAAVCSAISVVFYFAAAAKKENREFKGGSLIIIMSEVLAANTVISLIISRFGGYVYSVSADGAFILGTGAAVNVFALGAYSVLCMLVLVFQKKKKPDLMKSALYTLLVALALILFQWLMPDIMIQGTICCICMVQIFLNQYTGGLEADTANKCLTRQAFFEQADGGKEQFCAYIMVAMRNLRDINDYYGVDTTEKFIRHSIAFLQKTCGKKFVFRLTSSTYLMAVSKDATEIAEKIAGFFNGDITLHETTAKINAKVLLLGSKDFFKSQGKNISLLEYVNRRMEGDNSNNVLVIGPDHIEVYKNTTEYIQNIKALIKKREYSIRYKPVVDISDDTNKIVSLSSRAWVEKDGIKAAAVEALIKAHENIAMFDDINFEIFESACKFSIKLSDSDYDYIKVECAFRLGQLTNQSIFDRLEEIIKRTGVNFRNVVIEIWNDSFASDVTIADLMFVVYSIRNLGMQVSINDVHLHDIIKILFVMPEKLSIYSLADDALQENSGMNTVIILLVQKLLAGENVELIVNDADTAEAVRDLKDMGIKYASGEVLYGILSESEIYKMLNENRTLLCIDASDKTKTGKTTFNKVKFEF